MYMQYIQLYITYWEMHVMLSNKKLPQTFHKMWSLLEKYTL